uniref:Putative secreted peptide n=1 Tax=Anopheles braziliensis TaxID=58242 RepID=A0A2M3ZWT6_9DIPT
MLSLSWFMLAAVVLVLLQPLSMLRSIGRSQVRRFAKGCIGLPACRFGCLGGRNREERKKRQNFPHSIARNTCFFLCCASFAAAAAAAVTVVL